MADGGYEWADGEQGAYRRAVLICLTDDRPRELLERRPTVTPAAVVEAMCAAPYVDRLVETPPRSLPHRLHHWICRVNGPYRWVMPTSESLPALRESENYQVWQGGAGCGFLVIMFSMLFAASWVPEVAAVALCLIVGVPLLSRARRILRTLPDRAPRPNPRSAIRITLLACLAFPLWFLEQVIAARWISELQRRGLAEEVARAVEELLGDDRGTLLVTSSHEGLRSPRQISYFVKNGSADELQRRMAQLEGGTIALSGPRGVGKTTLMENCVRPGDFSVFAHAPATYAPHDFLISLFVLVCQTYVTRAGHAAPDFVRLSYLRRTARLMSRPLRRLAQWLALALPAAVLVGLGVFAAGRSLEEEHAPWLRRHLASLRDEVASFVSDVVEGRAPEAAVTLAVAGILLWRWRPYPSLSRQLKRGADSLRSMANFGLGLGLAISLFEDSDLGKSIGALVNPWAIATALAWLTCFVLYAGTSPSDEVRVLGRSVTKRRLFGPPALVLLLALLTEVAVDGSTRPLLTDDDHPARILAVLLAWLLSTLVSQPWSFLRPTPQLVVACRDHLYRLQTVQSSSAALTSGASQVLTLGTSHTSALTTVPPNYPVLVAEFRGLLTRIALDEHSHDHRVVIVIDELDRLGTDSQALAFLGEIKAILGVSHVHYLVSVAEDVGAAFVRRGLPHRDVTDSSLDDVVHVRPCTLPESTRILAKRAPGMGDAYVLLAHALSGGIPRDLIRYGRRLVEIKSVTSQAELPDVSALLIVEELYETLAGFRTLLAKQQWHEGDPDVLGLFRSVTRQLRAACPCPEPMNELRLALARLAAPETAGLTEESRQLVDEAAAYVYLSLTLLDVFGRPDFNRRLAEARSPDGDPDLLAEARQELSLSPYTARPVIDAIRRAWQLDPVSAQGPQPTAVIPSPRGASCSLHHRN